MNSLLHHLLIIVVLLCLFTSCVSHNEYIDLVARLEAKETILADDDSDGVLNQLDLEPDTPLGAIVNTLGVTMDSDGDGVADHKDKDPYSPPGYEVNAEGIAQVPPPSILNEDDVNQIIEARMRGMITGTGSTGNKPDLNSLNFPVLNIPPPPTRKMQQFPIRSLFPDARSYGDVNTDLSDLLGKAGFKLPEEDQPRYSYFQIREIGQFGGFAIVTDFEQTTEQGAPLANRFDLTVNRAEYTSIWERLFLAPLGKGYYRLFAFLIADEYFGEPGEQLSRSVMQERLTAGARRLHPAISAGKISPNARLHVLVYEFEQLESAKDGRPINMENMNVTKHLRAAGLSALLK